MIILYTCPRGDRRILSINSIDFSSLQALFDDGIIEFSTTSKSYIATICVSKEPPKQLSTKNTGNTPFHQPKKRPNKRVNPTGHTGVGRLNTEARKSTLKKQFKKDKEKTLRKAKRKNTLLL